MTRQGLLAVLGICLFFSPLNMRAGSQLAMRVSPPPVAAAPGFVKVSVTVDASDENRSLEIVAESATYYRSSRIPLNGARGPRVNVVELKRLPIGVYQVTGILLGAQGQRAIATQVVRVESVGAVLPD